MAYKDYEFVKEGVNGKAPLGFHYMPSGRLMSDADHIAVHGYVERKIKSISIDSGDINPNGGSKKILITGDVGFVFSLEVYEGDRASYYNFKTKTWSASSYKQTNTQSTSGSYSTSIEFPIQTTLKTFTINVYAETVDNIKTKHAAPVEVRNDDGSLNQNLSTGSDSDIVTKILYQDVIKNLYISTFAPSLGHQSTSVTNGAVSGTNRMVLNGDATDSRVVQVGDLITCTGIESALGVLVTKINPDGDNINEIEMSATDTVGDDVTVTFYPAFRGMAPNNISTTTGRAALEVVSGSSGNHPFLITLLALGGRGFSYTRLPTTEDLCAINPVTFGGAALPIIGEDVSGSTYYRWPITNIANLANGMLLDPSRTSTGENTSAGALISDYTTNETLQRIDNSNKYYTDFENYTKRDVFVSGVDAVGNIATVVDRNGRVTAKAGNITFSTQQVDALKSDADVLIIAKGSESIREMTGMSISVSDTTITPTQTTTTTTAASSASTTIAVTEAQNIIVGQTVRGVGVNSAVVNPTVVSKSAKTGAANIVVSSAQTLEDGITLYFDGLSNELLIRGRINVVNAPITDTTLYFDVEGFLSAN